MKCFFGPLIVEKNRLLRSAIGPRGTVTPNGALADMPALG
jgi:hypothetical protein